MYNYKTIVDDSSLTVSFIQDDKDSCKLNAVMDEEIVGHILKNETTFEASNDTIFYQYKLWQTRPERAVGKPVELEGKNMEELIEAYEELFIGAYILTQKTQVVAGRSMPYEKAIDWLRTTDFYTAPASTKYHEAFPGGLLIHSINVYNHVLEIAKLSNFSKVSIPHAAMAALVHDWCKIGYYESYQKNVKNEATGQWEKETAYKVNQKGLPLGHGVTSLYLAMQVMRLTPEQALAIRWHMGRWQVCDIEQNEFQKANEEYPMVYLIQFADELSCTRYA